MDWLARINEPYFRNERDAEKYVARELTEAVPEGWGISQLTDKRLTWVIRKQKPEPGEWQIQEYCVRVSNSLDSVIFTYGNKDFGANGLNHFLHSALIIDAVMLRKHGVGECLRFLFANCKPNEWGYS